MPFALLSTGLATQSQEEVRELIVSRLRAAFGDNVETSTSSVMGQIVDILSELHAYDQQVILDAWTSFDPNGATGVALDRIAKITQTLRKAQSFSTAPCIFRGTNATIIVDGSQVRLIQTQTVWEVIGGPYTIGSVVSGEVAGVVQAVDAGPVTAVATAPSGWEIVTPIAGWSTFETSEDADLGAFAESDKLLKQRRIVELSAPAQGPLAAIKANVSDVDGVDRVRVYHNPATSPVDADGIPFKAFNVVVETTPSPPDADLIAAIAEVIWQVQGAGGQAYGTDHVTTVVDSEGNVQPIAFDEFVEVNMYVRVTATTSTSEEPITPNLAMVIEEGTLTALRDRHEDFGQDVRPWKIAGEIMALDITGVDELVVEVSDDGIAWQTTTYSIGIRERADFDSSRFDVIEV
jgi:uncharacterized phage protein gp47/JayE